ncbi:MAG: hypothetical protein M1837_001367 [Sclerophora amabilis]|nr:MAG: hypothetical protein M1837_001367 [Sclerophora amabilis]
MDAYPKEYLAHNLPLIALSGLSSDESSLSSDAAESDYPLIGETGPRVHGETAPIATPTAKELLQCFLEADARNAPWNGRNEGTKLAPFLRFRLKSVGRDYVLPPRKAYAPPSFPDGQSGSNNSSNSHGPVLHSPISPLSPNSPVFPDGVITPIWIRKHQELVPSVFASFFTLTADPNLKSLHDNQLKTQINNTKKFFAASSYKIRFVVVLLSEKSVLQDPAIDERISNIRRATGLDLKYSLFFLPPNSSPVELKAFVSTFLTTLQPVCVEYYRDLSKHARRKRNRSAIPPPTAPPTSGTSQTLPSQGWNVRYEFKLGVLAEFRQEMDAACRNFESAYDGLLSQDVFESISSWSPRWNEARLLADVISIRIIRCLLWNSQTTSAVRRWLQHRGNMQDLVDRRGLGSESYGWAAWEARWAKVMAELIHKADIASLRIKRPPSPSEGELAVYSSPEKAISVGERLAPWEFLHHQGYWSALSAIHLDSRRKWAEKIPEEDRAPPGHSPASKVASRSYTYDTYLCPEPHIELPLHGRHGTDHCQMIVDELNNTLSEFRGRGQNRATERYLLGLAKELMRAQHWENAIQVLRPHWRHMSWRREGWWSLAGEVGWALRECAVHTGDVESVVRADWELHSNVFTQRSNWEYNLMRCIGSSSSTKPKPTVILKSGDIVSFLSATFAFQRTETHVGESLRSHLAVTSNAHQGSAPIQFSEIRISYEGSLRDVTLRHSSAPLILYSEGRVTECPIALKTSTSSEANVSPESSMLESRSSLVGEADLSFPPGSTKVFSFSTTPRDAGQARAHSATFFVSEELFDCEYILDLSEENDIRGSQPANGHPTMKSIGGGHFPSIKILPKPPKVQIRLVDTKDQFYTDEQILVHLEVTNDEEEEVEASLELRVLGDSEELIPQVRWVDNGVEVDTSVQTSFDVGSSLPGITVGRLAPSENTKKTLSLPAGSIPTEYALEVKVLYFLVSDLETPVSKSLTIDLQIVSPFEANYDFSPRLHSEPWPNFFLVQEDTLLQDEGSTETQAQGIAQTWCLTATVASFANEPLIIEDIELPLLGLNGGIRCLIAPIAKDLPSPSEINPSGIQSQKFRVEIRKIALEDRRSSTLDLSLLIKWRRVETNTSPSSQPFNSSNLIVPRLLIPSGEPRILATAAPSSTSPPLIHLDYTFENPSMHLLTFNLSMEVHEDFAFSGPKQGTLQLVPVSRRTVRFNIFPTRMKSSADQADGGETVVRRIEDRENWIQPQLKVIDRYYNRTLRVSAASEGMEMDRRGILIWVG